MEAIFERMQRLFNEAWSQAYEKMMAILPQALLAILIVIGGWIIASLIYALCVRVLAFFAIDKLVAKTPLDRMLKGMGVDKSASEILALLFFWLTILVTLVFASEILHLEQLSHALETVTRYIPQVIAAFLIIVFGMLLARFLQTVVTQSFSRTGFGYERSVGKGVQTIVLVFVFLAAVDQLGFDLSFVTTNMLIFIAAILLIVGVSVVLGARAILENAVACQQLKRQISVGQRVAIAEQTGRVKGFLFGGVVLETAQGETVIPATTFFKHTYTILS